MLYSFKKFKRFYIFQIDIKNKPSPYLKLSRQCVMIYYSTFFRKFFFRTLLFYINRNYSNFFLFSDTNFFYFTGFIHANYSTDHPSFYFKYFCTQ